MNCDIKNLTLEEKLKLLCGTDAWHTSNANGKLPVLHLSDGPHGLRKIDKDGKTVKATAMPNISTIANSWSKEMARLDGETIADECLENDVDVLLAPGVNIKRHPQCGRNFEYFSEDPFLAGELAKEYIEGVQSKGVGTSLKHYLANNCETDRHHVNCEIDERTLREIYLPAFEKAVKAKPYTVMCSYNVLNGVQVSENKKYLKNYLRDDFGFDGLIVSDWGAYRSAYKSIKATLDLVMPYSNRHYENALRALEKGLITMEEIDFCVQNVLNLIEKCQHKKTSTTTKKERHDIAVKIAEEGIVLAKNNGVLPLSQGKIAVCGGYSEVTEIGGGGSSRVQTDYVMTPLPELLQKELGDSAKINYVRASFNPNGFTSRVLSVYEQAYDADVTILSIGNEQAFEREDFDRQSMRLREAQESVIINTAKYAKKLVVILYSGSPIDVSAWIDKVDALICPGYAGEGVFEALSKILTGKVSPSGKFAETHPICAEDVPARIFDCTPAMRYHDGIYVGYRYYDTFGVPVAFPFGHGLSYATFEYSNLKINKLGETDYEVSYDITNVSNIDAKEVSQVYVKDVISIASRPEKELKGFSKDLIKAGETKTITVKLDFRSFAFWNVALDKWFVENGAFEILIGSSSSDIRLIGKINIKQDEDTQPSHTCCVEI